jgi:hypothetical protein
VYTKDYSGRPDHEEIENIIAEEIEEEWNDPEYQFYIAMRHAKGKRLY